MSSSAQVEPPKKSFLCCPAPFGNCCGGSKSRKTSPPSNVNDVKNDDKSPTRQNDVTNGTDDKKRDITSNGGGSDDKKNPFLSDADTSDNETSKRFFQYNFYSFTILLEITIALLENEHFIVYYVTF